MPMSVRNKAEKYILGHLKGKVESRNGYSINIDFKFQMSYKIHNLSHHLGVRYGGDSNCIGFRASGEGLYV